jgi:polygalacturonase
VAQANGNVLEFDLDEPCKLHLQINKLPRLFLFAEAPETPVPDLKSEDVRLLTSLDVVSSNSLTQTEQIQNALNATAARGATLFVPPGIYRTGTLELPSNLNLYLAPGAILKGTAQTKDYQRKRGEPAQLLLDNARNVRIFGRGTIDNNGLAMRAQFLPDRDQGRVRMLLARNCRNVTVEGIVLRDSAVWCVHTVESRDMKFRNLKIISVSRAETGPDTSHNTDGFDPDNSSNILIEDNFISVDDDAIAVKLARGKRRDMRNVIFRDNVIWTTCSALKIGTEVHDFTVRNVLFANNDIIHADTGIVVQCYRGGYVDGARWIGNHFEQVGTVANNSPHRKGANIYINAQSRDNFGGIRNLHIKDNSFERFSERRSMIRAAQPNQVVENVWFENLQIAAERRITAKAAEIAVDQDAVSVEFR